jgi:hypothetical protein
MKYCGIIDYENGMDVLADVIALVGQEEEELAQAENGWIDSSTVVVVDLFDSWFEAYPSGYSIEGLVFTELSEAQRRFIIKIFLELK